MRHARTRCLIGAVRPPQLLHDAVGAPGELQAEVQAALVRAGLPAVRVQGDADGGRLGDDGRLLDPALEGLALPLVQVLPDVHLGVLLVGRPAQ